MKTKSGEPVPRSLALRLGANPAIRAAWTQLRPSCQRAYVTRIRSADTADSRSKSIARVVELTRAYGERHRR